MNIWKNRLINEGARVMFDLLEMSEILNEQGFLVTVDIGNEFYS